MNLQSVVMVILRLAAISGFIHGLSYIVVMTDPGSFVHRQPFANITVNVGVLAVGTLVITTLVWVLALPIAKKVTHGSDRQLTIGSLTAEQLYQGIFLGVGAYHVVTFLASVLDWTFSLFKSALSGYGTEWMQGINGHDVFVVYANFTFGIILIAYSGALAAKAIKTAKGGSPEGRAMSDEKQ
jgi:hypothetical protein